MRKGEEKKGEGVRTGRGFLHDIFAFMNLNKVHNGLSREDGLAHFEKA